MRFRSFHRHLTKFAKGSHGSSTTPPKRGEVRIDAVDGEGESYGPVMLSIDAGEAVHFNSDDLESGNADNRRRWGRCGSRARRVWARC